MSKLQSIFIKIVGEEKDREPERYFLTITCFVASIFLLILCVIHIIMNLKLSPVFFAGSSSLVLMGLYYFVRFRSCLFYPKLILTIWGLVMLDFTWYAKFLSNGPVLFYVLIFGALVIWVWEGKQLALMVGLYFLNIALLFYIDYRAPEELYLYPAVKSRTLDIYLSFFLYASLLIILLYIVKNEFTRQTNLAVKSDKLKSAFLANMSHEIRTPMNAIVGFSQLINTVENAESREQYTEIIQSSSDNLLRLINDIIDLSKIDAGDMEMKFEDLSLLDIFVELKEMYLVEMGKRDKSGIKLDFELPDGDIRFCSDLLRLKQVLSNLISNAIKFTVQGSVIFSCRIVKNELVFSVKDTGVGIREEDQKRIFEQFANYNYEGLNGDGSGIGLAIVDRIVKLLNGNIWFESSPGVGSTFSFSIPHISAGVKGKSNGSLWKKNILQSEGSDRNILVVEDNELNSKVITAMLNRLNYKFHHVKEGEQAISLIKSNPEIRLVLMDMKLPGIDGYEATRMIKEIKPEISIIAQTAFAMTGDREKAIEAGCEDYLSKPIDLEKLMLVIKTYLKI